MLTLVDPTPLLSELDGVISDLVAINGQLAMIRAEELRLKIKGYMEGDGSDAARRRNGDVRALETTATAIELEAELFALTERKWLIQTKLKYADASR